jgi:hypothetical protein
MRSTCWAAALDADPVTRMLDDRLTHLITMYPESWQKESGG